MKKLIFLLAVAAFVASCGSASQTPTLKNSATYSKGVAAMVVTPMQADLQMVSAKKINYYLEVSENVRAGGLDNVIATAVKEALDVYGGDVLLGLETQMSYNSEGKIMSINITGFPAKYVNFRPATDLPPVAPEKAEAKSGGPGLPIFGKK
ncbi:MAG: hypothetical protein IKP46_03495 [Bacteroidales bacterium]|nr:hypothetical protein [Bacteroidales bacterium]